MKMKKRKKKTSSCIPNKNFSQIRSNKSFSSSTSPSFHPSNHSLILWHFGIHILLLLIDKKNTVEILLKLTSFYHTYVYVIAIYLKQQTMNMNQRNIKTVRRHKSCSSSFFFPYVCVNLNSLIASHLHLQNHSHLNSTSNIKENGSLLFSSSLLFKSTLQ